MNARVRGKIEMAGRVQEFARKHPVEDPGEALIVEKLAAHLASARDASTRQEQGRIAQRAANKQQLTLRKKIRERLQFLEVVARASPGFPSERPPLLRDPEFTGKARGRLVAARKHEDLLLGNGLSRGLLDDLERLIAQLRGPVREAESLGIFTNAGGSASLKLLAAQLVTDVHVLDAIYRYGHGDDVDLIAEWDMIRKIPRNGRGRAKEDGTRS
jgi:hypothetical protein